MRWRSNLVFIVALKIAGFSINFSSIFKIVFRNFEAGIVVLYLLKVQYDYFERNWFGNDAKTLRI